MASQLANMVLILLTKIKRFIWVYHVNMLQHVVNITVHVALTDLAGTAVGAVRSIGTPFGSRPGKEGLAFRPMAGLEAVQRTFSELICGHRTPLQLQLDHIRSIR